MRVSKSAMAEVERAFKEYEAEVDASNLSDISKHNYKRYVRQFVRWLNNDFTPGERA